MQSISISAKARSYISLTGIRASVTRIFSPCPSLLCHPSIIAIVAGTGGRGQRRVIL